MRHSGRLILALGLSALLAGPALAQRPGPGPGRGGGFMGRGGGVLFLLGNESVRSELKLDDAQTQKVNDLATKAREKSREQMQSLRDISDQEQRREKMRAAIEQMNEEVNTSLNDVLKPEQSKRLHQISLQQQGVDAFSNPRIQNALNLTDEQKSSLDEINQKLRDESRQAFQAAGQGNFSRESFQKVRELRDQARDKALGVLNDEQKAQWKELTGEPFEVRFEPGQRGGRRGNQ